MWAETGAAFAEAWRKLSIDVHAAAPASAARPRVPGGTWEEGGWRYADIGVFPTAVRTVYLPDLDHAGEDWIYGYDPRRDDVDPAARGAELAAAHARFRDLHGRPGEYEPAMGPGMRGKSCPACGSPVLKLSLGGGDVFVCPGCQSG